MIEVKILNVMKKIGPIIKDKLNEEKNFNYASLANIISKAREAMIEEKIIIIPHKIEQITSQGSDVKISMVYRFLDTEKDKEGKCDYIDVNIGGEGFDKEGWSIYKALSGAYKYAITQTFAIPTMDEGEMAKLNNAPNTMEANGVELKDGILNEEAIENMLDNPSAEDFDSIFKLGSKTA